MINMGYCKFENTLEAIQECAEELDSHSVKRLNLSELKSLTRIFQIVDEMNDKHRNAVRKAYWSAMSGK